MQPKRILVNLASIFLLMMAGSSYAAVVTTNSQASFLAGVGSATTYDFEAGSGFPAAGAGFATIGLFDGINFDAAVTEYGGSTSGIQAMTGDPNSFATATVTFAPGTVGFGFFGLDLTQAGTEVINVFVDFATGTDQFFDVKLDLGDPDFTPKYFGVYDLADTILSATLLGTEDENRGASRAWLIDDLSVATGRVPEIPVPAAVWLFGSALIGLMGFARRRKAV